MVLHIWVGDFPCPIYIVNIMVSKFKHIGITLHSVISYTYTSLFSREDGCMPLFHSSILNTVQ